MALINPAKPVPPRHVAIIMDGNGRWAQQRSLPRSAGHAAGTAGSDPAGSAGSSDAADSAVPADRSAGGRR